MHPWPDSPLITEADALALAALPPAVYAHSRRSFILATEYAARRDTRFDAEGLALAALHHDLGFAPRFADGSRAFTEIGAQLLADTLAKAGQADWGQALAEAIELHMQLFPRWSKGPEVGLLQVGAWMDATGRSGRTVGKDFIRALEGELPRSSFDRDFPGMLLGSIRSWRACARLLRPAPRPLSAPG